MEIGGRQIGADFVRQVSDAWWIWLVRGILAVILGILALVNPGAFMVSLALFLGVYFLIDGVITLFHGFGKQPEGQSRWPLIIWGIVAILAGLSLIGSPALGAVTLTMIIGIWAIIFGAMEIFTGIKYREEIEGAGEWWLIIGGVAAIIFGILILSNILAGVLTTAYLIGIWALISGVTLILVSFKIKNLPQTLSKI